MQQMDQQMNRQQKIMAAKASFQQTGGNAGFFYKGDFQRNFKENSLEEAGAIGEENLQTPSFHFGLVRFMASLMLLLLLLAAFSQDFSYRGFGQEYVQKCMADESAWNRLESRVQKIYRDVRQKQLQGEVIGTERTS